MQSTSKTSINVEHLNKWCQTHLKQALESHHELTEGWYNTILQLQLANNTSAIFKASPPLQFTAMRYEKEITLTEVKVLQQLAKHDIPVPKILASSITGEELGHPWFIMSQLQGESWASIRQQYSCEQCAQVDAQIAHYSAKVNQLTSTRFGRWQSDHCASTTWSQSFSAMFEDLLLDATDKNVSLPCTHIHYRRLLTHAKEALDQVKTPYLVLWDLHDGNVIVDPTSLKVSGIIDTDRALWGDPLMEYYFRSLTELSDDWQRAYAQVWKDNGKANPMNVADANGRMVLYELYLALVMLIEVPYRHFDAEHEKWARSFCERASKACAEVWDK